MGRKRMHIVNEMVNTEDRCVFITTCHACQPPVKFVNRLSFSLMMASVQLCADTGDDCGSVPQALRGSRHLRWLIAHVHRLDSQVRRETGDD